MWPLESAGAGEPPAAFPNVTLPFDGVAGPNVAILLADEPVMSSSSQKNSNPVVVNVLAKASTSEATTPDGTFAENVVVTNKNGVTLVVAAAALRTTDDGAGAFAGAMTLSVALIVKPAGAPDPMPNAGVTPATAGSDDVPAVPGIATNVVTDEPGLAVAVGCALGIGPVLPPAQPATIVTARNIATGTSRR